MKILLISIPNHHFFQWTNQLKDAGHEVYWFDITGTTKHVEKIDWVHQISGWKLRYDFPFRHGIKKRFPKLYAILQKINERTASSIFQEQLIKIKPDVVHCFDMELTGFVILNTMKKNTIPLIYSSWGSDIFYYSNRGFTASQVKEFLLRVDFLITDCVRDSIIASEYGFKGTFLGVFPGNGGIAMQKSNVPVVNRNVILVKGYQFDVGEAIQVVKAIEEIAVSIILNYEIIIYSADKSIVDYVSASNFFRSLKTTLYSREKFLDNSKLIAMMGESCLHIGNNRSDGIPNALLESMGMGAFPIQSNPGGATEEIITHGKNGYLIEDPLDVENISFLIKQALLNLNMREQAQKYNELFIKKNYDRLLLKPKILHLYEQISR